MDATRCEWRPAVLSRGVFHCICDPAERAMWLAESEASPLHCSRCRSVLSTVLLWDGWHMALCPIRAWPMLDGQRGNVRPYPCPACVSISSKPRRTQQDRSRRSYPATPLRSDRLQRRALAQQANATTPHEHPRIHIWGLPVIYNADGMITVRFLVCGRFISTQCNT